MFVVVLRTRSKSDGVLTAARLDPAYSEFGTFVSLSWYSYLDWRVTVRLCVCCCQIEPLGTQTVVLLLSLLLARAHVGVRT